MFQRRQLKLAQRQLVQLEVNKLSDRTLATMRCRRYSELVQALSEHCRSTEKLRERTSKRRLSRRLTNVCEWRSSHGSNRGYDGRGYHRCDPSCCAGSTVGGLAERRASTVDRYGSRCQAIGRQAEALLTVPCCTATRATASGTLVDEGSPVRVAVGSVARDLDGRVLVEGGQRVAALTGGGNAGVATSARGGGSPRVNNDGAGSTRAGRAAAGGSGSRSAASRSSSSSSAAAAGTGATTIAAG